MVHRRRIAEHVGPVAEHGDDWTVRLRQLGAECGAGSPAKPRRGTRPKIKVGGLEGAMFEEERVLVNDNRARVFGAIDTMTDPRRIGRAFLHCGFERGLPPRGQRSTLVVYPAPALRDRVAIAPIPERCGQRGEDRGAAPGDGKIAWEAADRVAGEQRVEPALDHLA